jgi:peptide/nickel transport system permease protein
MRYGNGGRRSKAIMRVLALVLRPFFIFFGVTGLGYALAELTPGTDVASYPSWLANLFPLDGRLSDAVDITVQLAVAAVIVGVAIGGALGGLMRMAKPVGPVASALSAPMVALAGPASVLFMLYWFALRFDLGFGFGGVPFADDPGEAIRLLVLPAIAIGVTLAPSLATLVAGHGRYLEPFGTAAAASGLASRCEQRTNWRFGLPAGLLATGLLISELAFNRPGLFTTLTEGILLFDLSVSLDALAIIALAGAGIALVVDLIGLRSDESPTTTPAGLRLAGYSSDSQPWVYWIVVAAIAATVLLATVAGLLTDPAANDLEGRLAGPLSEGHLLGSDDLGRDVLARALAGLGPALLAALVPGLTAGLGGAGVEALRRSIGPAGDIVPGALVDLVWWPLPVLAMFGVAAVGGADGGVLHPAVLALISLGLVPHASRMVRREMVTADGGGVLRGVGIGVLVAGYALLTHLSAGFAGFGSNVSQPTLGQQMSSGMAQLSASAWPAAVPAVTGMLLLAAMFGAGAGLVRLGWHRSASQLASTVDGAPTTIPIRTPGRPILTDPAITPNYGLQPGLPPINPYDDTVTVTMPTDGGPATGRAGRRPTFDR